ncbi:MAG TPA: cobalamin-binding protein [Ktedonobacteraceae bacterium]|nr:cobalamin-binding protein [Ktedonobacteraceae bacterium]
MRIVSLLASATEMVAALGCLDQLVGRSHECDYPPQVLELPVVSRVQINIEGSSAEIDAQIKALAKAQRTNAGTLPPGTALASSDEAALKALSIYAIDARQLQELRPDIILTQTQCEVCAVSERDVTRAVRQLIGLEPRVVSLSPYQLSDVWEDVLRVGDALGKREQAGALVAGYKQRLARLQEITRAFNASSGKPQVAVLEWLDPLMGAGNWTPELVAYAGGKLVFDAVGQHSPWISWEDLQAADPDVVVLSPCGYTLERTLVDVPLLERHAVWQNLSAVRNGRVYAIDGNAYINRSGPRLVGSAELLAWVIWGEQSGTEIDSNAWKHL